MAENKKKIKVLAKRRRISKPVYEELVELFQVVDQEIRPRDKNISGMDGTIYYFEMSATDGKVLRGEAWMPSCSRPLSWHLQ